MTPASTTGATQVLRLRNATAVERELWLESLGDRVVLAPNGLYELTATDAFDEIDFSKDGFTVYGWIIRVSAIGENGASQTIWELPPSLANMKRQQ